MEQLAFKFYLIEKIFLQETDKMKHKRSVETRIFFFTRLGWETEEGRI